MRKLALGLLFVCAPAFAADDVFSMKVSCTNGLPSRWEILHTNNVVPADAQRADELKALFTETACIGKSEVIYTCYGKTFSHSQSTGTTMTIYSVDSCQ